MRRPGTIALLALTLSTTMLAACSSAPEDAILQQFFRASRLNDNTSLAGFATTRFDPQTAGTVAGFDIVGVSSEQREPLTITALAKALDDERASEAEFTKRKDTYYLANQEAITRVLRAESVKASIGGKDAEIQGEWGRLRDESAQFSKKVSEAQRALKTESALVELSLHDPADPVDVTKQDGELVSKDVTVSAAVRLPDGTSADRTLIVTMRRAVLKGDPERAGKWVITGVRDQSASPPQTKTS